MIKLSLWEIPLDQLKPGMIVCRVIPHGATYRALLLGAFVHQGELGYAFQNPALDDNADLDIIPPEHMPKNLIYLKVEDDNPKEP